MIEATPAVRKPPVHGVELVFALDPRGPFRSPHLERNLVLVQGDPDRRFTDAPCVRAILEPVRPRNARRPEARSSPAEPR